MKTIKEWLKEGLSKEDYNKAKKYRGPYWRMKSETFKDALVCAIWYNNPKEGIDYWEKIYANNGSLKVIAKDDAVIDAVKERSLDMIVESVREDLLRRSQVGIEKYGTTLERTDIDLEGWAEHMYQELLDAACYLKRIMVELKNKK